MLIRFLIKNLYSFKETTELNLLPGRFSRLQHHVAKFKDIELLKLNAIYGANAAGKSNLVHALSLLKDFMINGEMPIEFITETFKFDDNSTANDVYLGIEFIKNNIPFYYGLTINQGIIVEEELQISGLGIKEDKILFIRTDTVNKKDIQLKFHTEIEQDREAALFPSFLKNEILERNKPVLHYMKNRQNAVFEYFKNALEWFEDGLELILPLSRPSGLSLRLERDLDFQNFATELMRSFNTGIENIHIETIPIEEYFGEDDRQEAERITANLKARPGSISFKRNSFEEITFLIEENKAVAKTILFTHIVDKRKTLFKFYEESDGTRRLMDYLPALYTVVKQGKTYLIDEIERSIHPLLIKELIRKFSHDPQIKGQLIFTTHESNLLDQEILRPDEIWFVEKNKSGATEIYSLSEFKEHHTIDIRKGYLNGRYGAIPFLGNLKDLNWEIHA